jgi:hypothetical protein
MGSAARGRVLGDVRGASLVEYLLLLAVVGAVALFGYRAFRRSITDKTLAQAACVRALTSCKGASAGIDDDGPVTGAAALDEPPKAQSDVLGSLSDSPLLINAVCAATSDRVTVSIARWATMTRDGRARQHLEHYLTGGGAEVSVDLRALLIEDPRVLANLQYAIMAGNPKSATTIAIEQQNYSNRDWLYALGGINIHWEVVGSRRDKVRLSFRDQYSWHPEEDRPTACVHQAAERLKAMGARDYWMHGEVVLDLDAHGDIVPPPGAPSSSDVASQPASTRRK